MTAGRAIALRDAVRARMASTRSIEMIVDSLWAEIVRLRQELRDYGEHDAGCYCRYTLAELKGTGWDEAAIAARVCACGLEAAIDGAEV